MVTTLTFVGQRRMVILCRPELVYSLHVVVQLCFALFVVLDIHGAFRGFCGMDQARTGNDRQKMFQTYMFEPGLSFSQIT